MAIKLAKHHEAFAQDRRKSRRELVSIPVTLIVSDILLDNCTVKDVSDSGAKILVPHISVLPAKFKIYDEADGFTLDVKKVWQSIGEVGIVFCDTE